MLLNKPNHVYINYAKNIPVPCDHCHAGFILSIGEVQLWGWNSQNQAFSLLYPCLNTTPQYSVPHEDESTILRKEHILHSNPEFKSLWLSYDCDRLRNYQFIFNIFLNRSWQLGLDLWMPTRPYRFVHNSNDKFEMRETHEFYSDDDSDFDSHGSRPRHILLKVIHDMGQQMITTTMKWPKPNSHT